jgi:signal transduction histidine kinase
VRPLADRVDRVVGYFRHAEPQPVVSGPAFLVDVAIAIAATIAALVAAIEGYLRVGSGNIRATPQPIGPGSPVGPSPPLPPAAHLLPPHVAHIPAWALVLVLLTTVPLAFRRIYPTSAFAVILVAVIATQAYSTVITVGAAIFAAYCAVVYSRYRRVALLTLIAGAIIVTAAYPQATPEVPERFTALLVLLPTVALGNMMRLWRQRAGDSAERLRRVEAGHEADTRRALDLERARIASELHDVVTHNVSVMMVQAGAARRVLESSPDDAEGARVAREALLAVEASGRTAMTELRHMLGLLAPTGAEQAAGAANGLIGTLSGLSGTASGPGEAAAPRAGGISYAAGPVGAGGPVGADASLSPQPGAAQIPAMLARVCSAGLPVELNVTAPVHTRRALPPGVDLAVYRVVQEALTNVIKYAPQARTVVRLEYRPQELRVTVSNDERTPDAADPMPGPPPGTGGRGLLGLRERVAIYGGDLDAGPRPGGGWRVSARIPLESAPDGQPDDAAEVQVIRTEFQAAPS